MTGPNLHLDSTVGCFFVGMVFAVILYGCTCAQVLYYFWQYPKDRARFKFFVFLLWALDAATTATHIETMWEFLLRGHGNEDALSVMPIAGPIEWFLAATVVVIVQLYYILTIWKFVRERWYKLPLTIIATMLSLLSYAFGIQDTHLLISHPELPGAFMNSEAKTASFVQPLLAAIADIYITLSLSLLLRREKSGFRRTSSILRNLQAILFVSYRTNGFYWSLFAFPGTRVYIVSTLAVLNARHSNRLGLDCWSSSGECTHDVQLQAMRSPISPTYPPYTCQEQPTTPLTGASDKFIMLTTEVVRHID
ncbi:hypothetical protein DAEQUDRAFT_308562 [Daedalea quercina L-15889]|uniref:DUF6534 domain-containing protein n=1 Tax=Daedalea quercina L-15889 TaxID=1314783 RepID=A0A165PXX2_9APHY|nr:hypothetical protein DAEQUDRAFT_308562 [Daedalea quercina L-15889]